MNLDELIDPTYFEDHYPELCKGMILSKQYVEPIEIGNQRAIRDPEHIEPVLYVKNVFSKTDEYLELVESGFTPRDIHEYVKLRFPVMHLGYKLLLRTYSDYSAKFGLKHLASANEDTPAMANFPCIQQWIKSQTVFSEVGRILFFVNEKDTHTPIHCDYADLRSRKDQFIWINPFEKKRFFVLDTQGEKHYFAGRINTFDNATWHGSEPAKHSCFTIRIDGLFSEDFLTRANLTNHYAKTSS